MPLTVEEKFNRAVEYVQRLPKDGPYQPGQDTKLKYYKYYKQATEGDVNTGRPTGFLDFVPKAKWDAWNDVKGMSKEEAQREYVALLVGDLKQVTPKSEELGELLRELE